MMNSLKILGVIATGFTLIATLPAQAANVNSMLSTCKGLAAKEYGTRTNKIAVKYEGQRSDGSHAVNGTYETTKLKNTFQCSFNKAGNRVTNFHKNSPESKVNEGEL